MLQLGDYVEDYTKVNFSFTTIADATLVPTVFTGGPVISVYKGSATGTEKTSAEAYITLDIDFDSKVGLNHVLIDLSADAFFVTGEDYLVVITTGTVGGASRIGMVVAHFSIENRSSPESTSIASILAGVITNAAGADVAADIIALKAIADAIKVGTIDNAAGADVATDIIAVKAQTADIEVDTGEIGTAGASLSDLGGMATAMKAEIKAECKSVMDTDVRGEPGQGAPGVSLSHFEKVDFLYKNFRNQKWETSTQFSLYNDAGNTVDQKAVVSDDGTTGKKAIIVTGP